MRVWAAAALLLAILAGAVLACGGTDSPTAAPTAAPVPTATVTPTATIAPAPTPTPAPSPTPVPAPAPTEAPPPAPAEDPPDPDSLLESSAAAMGALTSFHFESELLLSISAEGEALEVPISMTGDFQAPDRAKGTVSSVFEPGFGIESEFVVIGSEFYMTDPLTGQWGAGDQSSLGPMIFPPDAVSQDALEGLEDLVLTGAEVLNGVRTWRLSGSASSEALDGVGGVTLDAEVWIGADDLLVHGVALSGNIGLFEELTGGAGGASISYELWLSDHGAPVSIEAPETAMDIPTATEIDDCEALFDLTVSGGGGEFTPEVTSFRCLNVYADGGEPGLADQAVFATPADQPVELSFGSEQAPTFVEMRLYLPLGDTSDLVAEPEPVESLTFGSARDFSHVFAYGPGDYTLAVHAVWGDTAEVFYATNLRLE